MLISAPEPPIAARSTEHTSNTHVRKQQNRMKLIVQIPAYNEEKTIAQTIKDIPRRIDGITEIETLVVDDGSSDATADAAKRAGATHVVRLGSHRGLAAAFIAGIDASLRLGADIIVNTDADNQYVGADIGKLVAPIVRGSAEVVIGDRNVASSPHMSAVKRLLQRLGSWTVSRASGLDVPDVTSGFRAFSREAAGQINVFNPFTYTLETIIQAGNRNLAVMSVPVRTNPPTRPSRLYRGVGTYMRKSATTIFRIYTLYRPLKTFFAIGTTMLLLGTVLGGRFLYHFLSGDRSGHIQSLILAAILLIAGFQTLLIGLVADLISVNRRLSEEILVRLKRGESPTAVGAKPFRRERPTAAPAAATTLPSRPALSARPARRDKPAAPAVEAAKPATNWVWLMDEGKLDSRNSEPEPKSEKRSAEPRVAEPRVPERKPEPIALDDEDDDVAFDGTEVPAATTPRPAGAGRRRRRRRGGMRQSSDLPGNRGKHLAGEGQQSDDE
jgi:glycosyltransferase involved in cell wall biosynthesis